MTLCGLLMFAEKTRIIGLYSAENFENKYYVMSQIKMLYKPIARYQLRCEKLVQRQLLFMIPGIHEINNLFDEEDEKKGKGRKRGAYKSNNTRRKLTEDLPTETMIQQGAIDGFLSQQKGT